MESFFLKKLDYWLDRVSIYMHALAS
ncbi:MAG: hypothetical protein H6Q43_2383, partial [Deltaproteobacteria bacterium]|nr:hypothetical protein [Deltaproteobacteria bacterium]